MSTSSNDKGDTPTPPDNKSTVILLLGIAGDTTWRMFVPILGLTSGGVWFDRTYNTRPWMTIVGIVIGVIIAGLLVRLQFKRELPRK